MENNMSGFVISLYRLILKNNKKISDMVIAIPEHGYDPLNRNGISVQEYIDSLQGAPRGK